jgi:RND superfamily putative drug exporter
VTQASEFDSGVSDSAVSTRASALDRWGALVARRWRLVLTAGILAALVGAASYPYLRTHLTGLDWEADGSESAAVSTFIQTHFRAAGAEQDLIVFSASGHPISDYKPVVDHVISSSRGVHGVTAVVGPFDSGATGQLSRDGQVAFATVGLAGQPASRASEAVDLQRVIADAASGSALQSRLTGLSPIFNDEIEVEERGAATGETIGVVLALIVLVLALGSFVAACLPLIVTAASLLITFGVLALCSLALPLDSFIMSCVTMIGTGIAIDYSLFIVSRFRENLAGHQRAGNTTTEQATVDSVATAIATSGRTILIAGTVVAVSMCSLFVIRAPIYREIAIAIGVAVVCTLVSAMTVLPAALAALGPRINRLALPERWRPADIRSRQRDIPTGWARWARQVMRRPVLAGSAATLILVLAAYPLGSLRYGLDLGMSALDGTPSGHGAKILAESVAPGAISPIQVTAAGPHDQPLSAAAAHTLETWTDSLAHSPGVAKVDLAHSDSGYSLLTVVPATPVDNPATNSLVEHIRADAAAMARTGEPVLRVGGATAKFIDLGHVTRAGTPLVLALVLGSSLLFLLFVFRSVALAIKAVVMNMLTTAAAVGLTVAVFQWGHLSTVGDFTSVGFLQVYMPVTVFAVIFGLSMDYQVFLIRRIREEWLTSADNADAVVAGIAHTARPITAAAAIMVCVFGSFVSSDVLEMKELGFGLAVAIALDALLVRLVLVPALMRLLGRWNWWFPRVLDPISRADGR